MRRTYRVHGARVGLAALIALLVLLGLPGTSNARGASETPVRIFETGGEPLAKGAGYGEPEEASRVRALQRLLRRQGWRPGPVDGLFGPLTEAALTRFQQAAGLAADGIVGPHTGRALREFQRGFLRRGAGYANEAGSARVRRLQARLAGLGLRPGPADGRFGPRTEAAVARLQQAEDLAASGVANAATRRLLADPDRAVGTTRARDRAPSSTPAPRVTGGRKAPAPGDSPPAPRVTDGRGAPPERTEVARDRATNEGASDNPRAPAPGTSSRESAAEDAGSGTPDWFLPVGAGALGVALAILIGLFLHRRRRGVEEEPVPLEHGLMAEGHARDRSVGWFSGEVRALVLSRRGPLRRQRTRYLVHDPDKPQPFWVADNEVARLVASAPHAKRPEENGDKPAAAEVRALGYISVPKPEPLDEAQLRRQAAAIDSACEQRGWKLLELVSDVEGSRGRAFERPGLKHALERLVRGEASCLVVAELRRLHPSVSELGLVLQVIGRSGGRLVALDLNLDTSLPSGRKAANALVSIASWDRARKPQAAGRDHARVASARGGRPDWQTKRVLKERIAAMRASGLTLQQIADRLNEERVPTLRGGAKWRPSSVQSAVGYRRPARRPQRSETGGGLEKGRG
jgi:peptidoglycan hydrolase-like protein with peptidoglycan-binding domain/DNA invertase Pin-like site-specific DNA recombinase